MRPGRARGSAHQRQEQDGGQDDGGEDHEDGLPRELRQQDFRERRADDLPGRPGGGGDAERE